MANQTLSKISTLGYLLGIFCFATSTITQAEEPAAPAPIEARPSLASREMLEFLAEFSELGDTEFELLTAYAEQDSAQAPTQEPKDSDNE